MYQFGGCIGPILGGKRYHPPHGPSRTEKEFHDGSGKKHVAAQLAGALAPHTPHFLGPRPHLARRGAAPWTAWCTFAGYSSSVPR